MKMSDHERIWLEPAPGADEEYGRQWCQHNAFGDEATEYVRADLFREMAARNDELLAIANTAEATVTALQEKLKAAEEALEPFAREAKDFATTWPTGLCEKPPYFSRTDLRRARSALATIRRNTP